MTAAADGLNRDAAIAATGGYDKNGNLTYDGVRTFTGACPRAGRRSDPGDAENRLLSETGPVSLSLSYDPMGRLEHESVSGGATNPVPL